MHTNGMIHDFLMHETWIQYYFDYFNCIFPVLSKSQFQFQLENNSLHPLLRLAVFALGCRLHQGNQEADLVQQFHSIISHDMLPDISIVQALAIMCWYSCLAGDMQQCHSLRHYLATMVHKLNLGYESTNRSQDMHLTEMKRRAFWTSFVLDQWLASCTDTKSLIIHGDCKYPQLEESQLSILYSQQQQQQAELSLPDTLESAFQINSFKEMIRLAHIVGDIAYGHQSQLESNLTEWLLQLPSYLDFNSTQLNKPSPITKIYRILYYTAQIMMSHKQQRQNILSSSICTTAANTIIHISEHMVASGQKAYLSNVFFLSLTLATSIHLDNTLMNGKEHGPDKVNLIKSISLIKDLNSTCLSRFEFDQLLDHFLLDRCDIRLESVYPSPSTPNIAPRKSKRSFHEMENDLPFFSPPSTPVTESSTTTIAVPLTESFDINQLLVIDEWPANWTDILDQQTIESCSITYLTPSQSPSLNLKEENLFMQQYQRHPFSFSFSLL
ncbi:fungal-specific transcription factor domain-containing protein [Gilbertella persicaria]|uniref:fungal-specific transcription factor domain-containing protein n=1 Tax=Gilbertella persicaria TaxID=101096 RepID=UPI00221EF205|nr:fungal-specific transcription factor domain-containing protein [Gilbertella persicaria]KAI8078132.1 fungal-specific transcription factor domain-containing protein [Gilbertella persicaria]